MLALHDQIDAASAFPSQAPRYRALRRPLEFALTAGIAVVHELDVGAGVTDRERHPQRVQDQVGTHVGGELPAHDHPAEGVDHEAEEHDALMAAQIREVRQPQPVRPRRREIPVDEIRVALSRRVRCCGAPRLAAPLRALDPVSAHQPLDTASPGPLAVSEQRLPHPPAAVGEVVGRMQLADALEQPLVFDLAL